MRPHVRGSSACSICHKKKVKCDLSETNQPCTNCRLGEYTCRPHKRRRKVYSLSPSPPRDEIPHQPSLSTVGTYTTALSENTITANTSIGVSHLPEPIVSPQQSLPQNDTSYDTPTVEQSYVGRSEYLGGQVPFTEDTTAPQRNPPRGNELTDLDTQVLTLRKAFDLPPRTIRESLVDAFMERCHPWMPIVERQWLEDREQPPSLLLLQSVFLAGSRVLSSPLVHTSSSEFYERAKALFFSGHEQNTTLAIVAISLLQWWNPTGPEKFSTNTSGFWVRICVELAYQVGLHKEPPEGKFRSFRRRLWWTLVTRDSIISVGTGRPRTINLEDSNMRPPTVEDFATPNAHASLFVAYVSICRHMGDIAEAQRRQSLKPSRRQRLEDALFRWVKELPRELRIAHQSHDAWVTAPYSLEARQLAVPYFVSLILLHRCPNTQSPASTACLLASSFIVSIFEEFLSRDHMRYLGPVFAFYALAAGLIQLTGFRYKSLQAVAEHEFGVVKVALEELGKRWGSAQGALRGLLKAKDTVQEQPLLEGTLPSLSPREAVFFSDFGSELCKAWDIGFGSPGTQNGNPAGADLPRRLDGWDYAAGMAPSTQPAELSHIPQPSTCPPGLDDGSQSGMYPSGMDDMSLFADPLAHMEGFWLFENFEYPGHFG